MHLTLKLLDCDIRSGMQDGWESERGKLALNREDLLIKPRLLQGRRYREGT